MGGPKPWPTRWPEPSRMPYNPDTMVEEPLRDPDYEIEKDPQEPPHRLPENYLTPYAMTWGITHPCNLRCTHCYDVVPHKRTDLTTDQALQVIERLDHIGITFLVFSGGEPLLRKDLFGLMAECRKRGIEIGMRSNGTMVNAKIAHRLAELELAVAGISLDGDTEESHDAIRGRGSFQKTLAGVKALLDVGIRVNIEVVLSRSNAEASLQFVQLAETWGVTEVNFSAIAPQGRAQHLNHDLLDHTLWYDLNQKLYNASLRANVIVSPSCALIGPCWACIEPNITCDGWVTPCYLSQHRLFHILETSPEETLERLQHLRPETVDICGRNQWLTPGAPEFFPHVHKLDIVF